MHPQFRNPRDVERVVEANRESRRADEERRASQARDKEAVTSRDDVDSRRD